MKLLTTESSATSCYISLIKFKYSSYTPASLCSSLIVRNQIPYKYKTTILRGSLAVPWLRRLVAGLSPQRPGLVHVGFVLDHVALWQVFLRVLRFPLSVLFHRASPYSYITWEMNNRPFGGRISETLSHPIDMNKTTRGSLPSAWLNCLSTAEYVRWRNWMGPARVSPAARFREAPCITSCSSWNSVLHSSVSTSLKKLKRNILRILALQNKGM
jgi:hypothetical protein